MKVEKTAEFDFRGNRYSGEVVKENEHTVWVKVRAGGKTFDIKRHREKHGVVVHGPQG